MMHLGTFELHKICLQILLQITKSLCAFRFREIKICYFIYCNGRPKSLKFRRQIVETLPTSPLTIVFIFR